MILESKLKSSLSTLYYFLYFCVFSGALEMLDKFHMVISWVRTRVYIIPGDDLSTSVLIRARLRFMANDSGSDVRRPAFEFCSSTRRTHDFRKLFKPSKPLLEWRTLICLSHVVFLRIQRGQWCREFSAEKAMNKQSPLLFYLFYLLDLQIIFHLKKGFACL